MVMIMNPRLREIGILARECQDVGLAYLTYQTPSTELSQSVSPLRSSINSQSKTVESTEAEREGEWIQALSNLIIHT